MSKDFKLKQTCPHSVVGEWLAIEDDRRTLRPVKNPSSGEIEIQINGKKIPKKGLYSDLSISTQKSEPFEITEDHNEIKFSVNNKFDQKIQLPRGTNLSANQIADRVEKKSSGLNLSIQNGKITFGIEQPVDRTKKSFFLKGGSAHKNLGLPKRRFYRNKRIHPPWSIVKEENSFDQERKKIVFEEPLKSGDDIIEISYFTKRENCRRCQGLGIEDDIRHNQEGDPQFVRDEDLLLQEARKIVFTVKGSNVFYEWYGTNLVDSIGSKISQRGDALQSQFITEISSVLDRYRQIKTQQSQIQPVSNRELLLKIRNVNVQQDNADPSVFRVQIELINRSNEVERLSKTIVLNANESSDRRFVGS